MRIVAPGQSPIHARLSWSASGMSIAHAGREFSVRYAVFPNGERDGERTFRTLAKALRHGGIEIESCGNCARFRFSGMSQQSSGGKTGYCGLVGFRNPRGIVAIDHGCSEHIPVDGWPDDAPRIHHHRLRLNDKEPQPSRLNAFAGAICGLAIGDALGFPAEFRRREQIVRAFGAESIRDFVAIHDRAWPSRPAIVCKQHPPGTYTDDTQLSLAVAESLIEAGSQELDVLMRSMARRFVEWSRSPDNDRCPGATTMQGCANLADGVHWQKAGIASSKGCGSAMRVAPIGLYYWQNHSRLFEVARASSMLTHRDDAAIESAAAAALLVALALEKKTPRYMYDAIMQICGPRSTDFRVCLEKVPRLLDAPPEEALTRFGLGEGWVAEEAVASALYCFWKAPESYEEAVLMAVNTDGDSDTIACIVGGISGAFNGGNAIPSSWRQRIENRDYLEDVARRLCEASQSN